MPKKILIIEDDPVQLEFYSAGLKKHNYSVTTNLTGQGIPEQIKQEKPDIILLDIVLPKVSGLKIAEYLHKEFFPYIFVSSSNDQNILEQAYNLGALGFLLKPVNINQLVVEIETALHWHSEKIQLNRRKENINITIENNRKISVSIGLIMERYQINGSDAFESIRSAARSNQCRILDIAIKIIEDHENTLTTYTQTGCMNIATENKKKNLSNEQILNDILAAIAT